EGVHLTEDGRAQAEKAAEKLSNVRFTAIYSSPIDRCFETAEIVAARHPKLALQKSKAIGEVQYGRWTNRSLRSLAKTKLWTTVQHWPSAMRFPDGESLREVQMRAVDEIERLKAKHPKGRVCVVSHADVIKLVLAHYLGVHLDLFQRIVVGPASISVVGLGPSGPAILALNT
ncbi:MAG: histidine phosphatase family protein, partial [Actinomycetota bacterium]